MTEEIKKQLDKIEAIQDKHQEILASIDKTLAIQAQHLEYHIKRTTIAEENIDILRKSVEPLHRQYHFWGMTKTGILFIASVIAAAYYLLNFFKLIK